MLYAQVVLTPGGSVNKIAKSKLNYEKKRLNEVSYYFDAGYLTQQDVDSIKSFNCSFETIWEEYENHKDDWIKDGAFCKKCD